MNIWRAGDPKVVASLHEAREIQALYAGGRIPGLNLGSPDERLSAAVPILRQARVRLPGVTMPESQRAESLRQLGVSGVQGWFRQGGAGKESGRLVRVVVIILVVGLLP